MRLVERAPAKVNLTLHVLGRRPDGYHQLESLVAFAGAGDTLSLTPGAALSLAVHGPTAGAAGPDAGNLVLKAARALAERVGPLKLGAFHLAKRLPVAAGLGGGSADAAAALRLLARLNDLPADHTALIEAARATGADVPVCLSPRARLMAGIGEILGPPVDLPPLFCVLVNPGVPLATADVFRALNAEPLAARAAGLDPSSQGEGGAALLRRAGWGRDHWGNATPSGRAADGHLPLEREDQRALDRNVREQLLTALAGARNDLEALAIRFAPAIGDALGALRASGACRLARMSGSGATVFGLYDDCRSAAVARRAVLAAHPTWWAKGTVLR
jgi:4-diphosphocytidyl-2-C-methyl-D-erythritol kinase